ncbi:PstS family phosphate ABC transporter substrate-binding protein [Denitromonas iodatirespirans]|uniref:PstS family phosphate ABC transporter substrate-binding protein n=1 Tax=Denitromonas iodatirespirans TaxID=2795389 RepID=A0A944H897_DENI1|nr:PstS family phosphate ABC transporter substrate-binding protein [Denitromonas iodatirespirans]MBT0961989.1 PstS family phosphate ABC transporter substrate-binding protein [Denitromonas iodatirespirans]
MKKAALALAVLSAAATSPVFAQSSRDYISIVGSSTVYPFATVVAEQFGKATKFKTPKIESTGSGGGIKLFCAGVGVQHPDITNASRAIKKSELEQCAANGVKEVVEVKIGYDGLSVAESKKGKEMQLTRRDLFLALAKQVPNPNGTQTLVDNPYKTWKDVNAALPAVKIEVLGPPPTSGTRDAFVELVMDHGCESFDFIKAMKKADKKAFKATCQTIREDGAYVEAGENDNLIVQKLDANPSALGIFGFSFLDQNRDKVRGLAIEGVQPEFETISNGSYPVSRPLFFYVKKAHVEVIPGMKEFIDEFLSKKAMGNEGYLAERGLIPLPKDEYAAVAKSVKAMEAMK